MAKKNDSWWQRMRHKYRLAVLDDMTLREVFHMRLSGLGTISVLTLLFLALLVALSLLIVYTPIRNILPGYSENLRQQLIVESARIDSLQTSLTVQRQYLDDIKRLAAGDIPSDSVQRLDSMEIIHREQILQERNAATDAFMAQYEQQERDRLLLFDNASARSKRQLYRPVRGVISQSARPDYRLYSTVVRVAKNENVLSVMRGTIVSVERAVDNTFTIIIQQNQMTCIFRRVTTALKPQGASIEAGESVGLMDGKNDLLVELWDAGQYINPEEVIVW